MQKKKKKRKRIIYKKTVKQQIAENKKLFAVYVILRILVVIVMIAQFYNGNYENVFLCVLTLFLFTIPSFIENNFHIDIPDTLEVIILLFIFSAEILGEIQEYYIIFPYWDTMLHTINGFLAAAIGFSMVDLLNKNENFSFKLSPLFMAIVAFCFSMTIGVLWEFFECGMDLLFATDMQKDTVINSISTVMLNPDGANIPVKINNITSVIVNGQELGLNGYLDIGLLDTMKDMFVNFIGAAIFSIIGYFFIKKRSESKIFKRFIPKALEKGRS